MRHPKNDKKSVVCGYCYTHGHNRQTCPQLCEDMERVEAKHGPGHPLVIQHKRHRKAVSKSASARAKMPRCCTYCHTLGHNRRTCPILKIDRVLAIEKNAQWRKGYYMNIESLGLGIGAMLKIQEPIAGRSPALWMVLRHEWSGINYINEGEAAILCQQISNVGRRMWLTLPPTYSKPSLTLTGWEVVSPSFDFGIPAKWFTGELGVDSLFEDADQESRII